jgi:peptidoglycan hydrolase-like protein with peptidoglycan-binding domain
MDSKTDVPIILTDKFAEQVAEACVEVIVEKGGLEKKSTKTEIKTEVKTETPKKDNKVLEWQKAAIKDGFKFGKYGADGKWGKECETIAKAAVCKKRLTYKYKNLTKIVQAAVGVAADGKFGNGTKTAVIKYQKKHGLTADGCVGLSTWKKILNV